MHTRKTLPLFSFVTGLTLALCTTSFADTMQDAREAIDKKDYSTAIIHLKNQLKESPKDAQARFLLGNIYLTTGKLQASVKELGRAHEYAPEDNEILFRYAESLQAAGEHGKLLKLLKKPLSNKTSESQRLSYIGYAHLAKNQLGDAKANFEQANQLHKSALALNGLANLALHEKDLNQAEQFIEDALIIEPNNRSTLQLKAKLSNLNKQHKAALKIYNQLIENNTNNLQYRLERAATYAVLKDNIKAKADINFVLSKVENHPQANFIKAQILLQEQDFVGAQAASQKVVNAVPQHMPAALILGASNFALKNYNQAAEYLIIYMSSDPSNLKAQNLLANVYLEQGKIRQALLILEGIPQDKLNSDPQLLISLGAAYIRNGESEKGIRQLKQAQKLAPDNQDIRKRLIAAEFQSGEMDNAISELEQLTTDEQSPIQGQYLLIVSYIKQKQFDKADEKLQQLINKTPEDIKLLLLRALNEQLKGNTQAAITQYKDILKKDKNNIPAYMGLAQIAAIEKKWQEASDYFKKILTINPKAIKAYLGLAAIAGKQNQHQQTEQYFLDAIEASKEDKTSQMVIANLLSQWYQNRKEPEKILTLANELQKQYPNDSQMRQFLARAQLVNGQNQQAEKTLQNLIALDKKDIESRVLLAKLISQTPERTDEVLSILRDTQTLEPDNLSLYTYEASVLIKRSRFDEAIFVARNLQLEFPDQNTGQLLEADIYQAQKQYEKALKIYQKVYNKTPDKKILTAIVDMMLKLKQTDNAIEVLNTAVETDQDDVDNMFKLASLYHGKNELEKAEKYYQRILKKIPNHIVSLNNLAWIHMENNAARAVELSKKAHELSPNSAAITDTYGFALVKNKQYEEGLNLLIQASENLPKDKDIQYHLAYTYEKTGNKEKAVAILKELANSKDTFSEQEKANKLYQSLK